MSLYLIRIWYGIRFRYSLSYLMALRCKPSMLIEPHISIYILRYINSHRTLHTWTIDDTIGLYYAQLQIKLIFQMCSRRLRFSLFWPHILSLVAVYSLNKTERCSEREIERANQPNFQRTKTRFNSNASNGSYSSSSNSDGDCCWLEFMAIIDNGEFMIAQKPE